MDIGLITNIERKLRPGKSAGQRDTYVATAKRLQIHKEIPVYFKVFDKKDTDKGIYNEILGFNIARTCGLPVVRDTFICVCNRSILKGPARCLQDRDPSETHVPGVASIDANPHNIKQIYDDLSKFEVELLNWRHLAQVAVYDELIFNTDRTSFNLVRINKYDYVIIDHENILGGVNWDLEQLEKMLLQPSQTNHLASLITSVDNQFVVKRMVKIAQEYINRTYFTKDIFDIDFDIESFCHLDKGVTEHILYLLEKRIKLLPELIYHHIHAGQMFDERS